MHILYKQMPLTFENTNADDANSIQDNFQETGVIDTDEQLFSAYAKPQENVSGIKMIKKLFMNIGSCSSVKCKHTLLSLFPIANWLPKYDIKKDLLNDFTAGITVGVVHLPQGMAYSLLAGLPPIVGLYVSFFPVLIYALFGSTRQLSVGTFAVVSLMVDEAISGRITSCVPQTIQPNVSSNNQSSPFTSSIQVTTTDSSCLREVEQRKIEYAIALSVAVAIIHFCMFVLRLGILNVFLSSHMVSGFTCGAAFHVFTSQVSKLFGIKVKRKSGPLSIIYTYIELFSNFSSLNWATVIVSLCCIVALFIGKEINRRYKAKLPFPLPWELVVVIFSTIASTFAYLNLNYNVEIVEEIPQGIQTSIPSGLDVIEVFVEAIPISIVIFSISISLSSVFSEKHGYDVNANQELLAYSLANLFGSFFQCFPCSASLSRSLVWEQAGGKTQITGLFSCVLILVTLLWIGPLFEPLPLAVLASIIVVNLKNMLLQFRKLKPLWKVSKIDAFTWLVTWLSVVLLGVDFGLYIGVAFSLFTVVLRTQITFGNVMVAVGPDKLYRSSTRFDGVAHRDIVIFRFPSPLIYANQARFKHQLSAALGFKPNFEVALRNELQSKSNKKQSKKNDIRLATITRDETDVTIPATINDRSNDVQEDVSDIFSIPTLTNLPKPSQKDNVRIASNGMPIPLFVILDMSICPFIDNDGVLTVKSLLNNLSKLGIRLLLARCSSDVRACLLNGKFPSFNANADNEPLFFVSLEKAVEYSNRWIADNLHVTTSCPDQLFYLGKKQSAEPEQASTSGKRFSNEVEQGTTIVNDALPEVEDK